VIEVGCEQINVAVAAGHFTERFTHLCKESFQNVIHKL
jgi:hypothetical protein